MLSVLVFINSWNKNIYKKKRETLNNLTRMIIYSKCLFVFKLEEKKFSLYIFLLSVGGISSYLFILLLLIKKNKKRKLFSFIYSF